MIKPEAIPQYTGDLGQLEKDHASLKADAGHIRDTGSSVHTHFQALSAYYQAPEAEQLFASTKPVKDRADGFADDLEKVASSLSDYASEIRPLVTKLTQLKTDATTFVNDNKDDDDWEYDGDKVEEHNQLRDDITATVAAFWAAERTCHNKITALFGGTQMVAGDGSDRKDQYGFNADDLKNAKLPWGDPVEEKHHWYEVGHWVKSFVWDGLIVDGIWGTIKGLGTLVGFGGWDAMGQAWKGLAQLATGLVISSIPGAGTLFWTLPDDKLPSWLRDSRTAMKETGKALVAWDEWGKNPGRAAGAVTFNVLTTVFTGGAGGAAAGAGKAGAVAKVLSVAGKAGKVIDPMTYIAKGAGAGLSKIGDITKGLKGISNIDIPKLPDGSVQLPDGRFLEPNGNLVAPNGVVETTPIPHDTVPGTSGLPSSWQVQQPVPVGVHAGSGFPDMAAHTPGGGFDNVPYGPGSQVPGGAPNHVPNGSFGPAPAHFDPASHLPGGAPGHVPGNVGAHVPTDHFPAGAGHDIPGGNPHTPSTPDAPHTPHTPDAPHTPGHDGPGTHGHDGSHGGGHDTSHGGHADDAAAHADDAAHAGDHGGPGSHVDPHGTADDLAHGADDATAPGHHGGDGPGLGPAADDFKYTPHVSEADFDSLSTAEKHRVAASELTDGTVPFADDFDAVQYGRDYWNDYVDNLDPSAQQALRDYTGDSFPSYKDMNGYLRNDPHYGPRPEVLHDISEMDRVMSTRPVPEDVMVVRGTGIGHLDLDSPLEMMGGTFGDEGYLSTSLGNHPVPSFAGKDAILHLRVPKGTPALWLEKVSHYGVTEREILLGRGSEYRVTRVFVDEAGQAQVYGEVLPK
ncbi:protein phosphatase [Streptomyces sp. NBC_00257]|uniref:ADP-ribosyltransferase n=1 Tax=unclassified Streptomyces TaxID=2593676 RepID=UPI00225A730C|nr:MULTISPECIES: ADP-ribosyltransferase [unclassified Streptomyces]WTB56919.1 protein phosphatase [Streptomyces sp. NBC_00826]WTC94716.1 protein phosphatase [Streptomyces sp. NBC_01650]WTH90197.1 protein phosphatase [Streptomyces sp. NBC_00825]WTH98925.1 protein phosphatase [Streptomyces sp. NBC_00822]MCX4864326.1 protein phosphatase [Streptomyces sp. NBC_00906]